MSRYRRNESRSAEEIRAENRDRFRDFVRFVEERSPYYAERIRANGIDVTHCAPEDFPALTKNELLENFDRIVTDPSITLADVKAFVAGTTDLHELYRDRYLVSTTSGTSGSQGYFLCSFREAFASSAMAIRFYRGSHRRTAQISVSGHHIAYKLAHLREIGGFPSSGAASIHLNCFDRLETTVAKLNDFQPTLLTTYARIAVSLAEAQQRGELRISPEDVQTGGEPLSLADRRRVEDAFGCNVVDVYASAEHLYMAFQRSDMQSMCLLEDDLIFEIHPTHTNVTNLLNRSLPLIRYHMDDLLLPLAEPTPAPYRFTQIAAVGGRFEDLLTLKDAGGREEVIHPNQVLSINADGVRQYQLYVRDETHFDLRVRLEAGLSRADRERALRDLQSKWVELLDAKGLGNVGFGIEEVDDLPSDPTTGKFRMIVREAAGSAGS